MMLTPFIRSTLYAETGAYADRESYISDMALSSIWGRSRNADIPKERIALLGRIWDATHCTVQELAQQYGLSQTDFARYFGIPLRTVQGWFNGSRSCPPYVLTMAAEILALNEE